MGYDEGWEMLGLKWEGKGEPKSEHDEKGFAIDWTYSDTNRVLCKGSRELRAHWDIKFNQVYSVHDDDFSDKSSHPKLSIVGFCFRQCPDE